MTSSPLKPVQFLTRCGLRGYIPSWLARDFVHECSLGEDKSVLLLLLSGQIKHDSLIWENKITFKCWFSSFGHLILLHLRALGVALVRLGEHSTFQIIKSCLSQENKTASKCLCGLHLRANSEFLVWTTRASEMIVCVKSLEIWELREVLMRPPAGSTQLMLLSSPESVEYLLYVFPRHQKGCEVCRDRPLLKVYLGLMNV